jgi:lipopolysaccharide/colanic/teichoic acid biosynthesis glycosyltransferase
MMPPSRTLDVVLALPLFLLALPLMAIVAVSILLGSGPPILFAQVRAGEGGRNLKIHKFRTLRPDTPGDTVTPEGDPHVTRVGRLLRRYRLDELPQLLDVLCGGLSLVGPRPEREIDLQFLDPVERRMLLSIRPGITGPAQLEFIGEDLLLARVGNPDDVYRRVLVPAKCTFNLSAFRERSWQSDVRCLVRTVGVLLSGHSRRASLERLTRLLDPQAGRAPGT